VRVSSRIAPFDFLYLFRYQLHPSMTP
jgi:hypothetical protein